MNTHSTFAVALPVVSTIVMYAVAGRIVTFTGGCVMLRSALRVSVPSHIVSGRASNVTLTLLA